MRKRVGLRVKHSFLDFAKLVSDYQQSNKILHQNFSNIIVVGAGGSTQGSKAITSFLCEKRVIYFDHLDSFLIDETINKIEIKNTCFMFISKSGETSEILIIFEYLKRKLEKKIVIKDNFIVLTEIKSSTLGNLALQNMIKTIEYNKDIGGRFSIFSNVSLLPGFYFQRDFVENFLNGGKKVLDKINDTQSEAKKEFTNLKNDRNIFALLTYGCELTELALWKKQLYAESLGKNKKGIVPIWSEMPKDQHSMLQLYLDGPDNIYFEILGIDYKEINLINMTLTNHMNATFQSITERDLPCKMSIFKKNDIENFGYYCGFEMIKVVFLGELMGINPFDQPAVDNQKKYLN